MTNQQVSTAPTDDFVGEARVNPATGRAAGPAQGILLLAGSCLPVLGSVLLAPVLPAMSEEFADTPGSEALVPLVLTAPALFIALLAPFAGAIIDKLGRKRVLIVALLLYALLGTAPLWVVPLGGILATRVGVGITEAFIMTCCTTLIADYFTGGRRDRYLSLQALVTALAATAFFGLGGALGAVGWRAPFWLYASSLVIALVMMIVIWPTRQSADGGELTARKLPPMVWRPILLPIVVTFFGGIVFYTLIVELPYLLVAQGVTAPAAIGGATALASLATAIGTFLFRWLVRFGTRALLTGALGLAGAGLLVVALAPAVPVLLVGAVVTSLGTGLLLPTLITWAISRLHYEQRGRGTGAWTSSLFLGQFLCPLLVLALTAATGGLAAAIGAIGVASLVIAGVLSVILRGRGVPSPA